MRSYLTENTRKQNKIWLMRMFTPTIWRGSTVPPGEKYLVTDVRPILMLKTSSPCKSGWMLIGCCIILCAPILQPSKCLRWRSVFFRRAFLWRNCLESREFPSYQLEFNQSHSTTPVPTLLQAGILTLWNLLLRQERYILAA